jgi:Flp pilus assembly protein TadG
MIGRSGDRVNKNSHVKLAAGRPPAVHLGRGIRQPPRSNSPRPARSARSHQASDFSNERGSALVEHAIVLVVLMTLLFGIMDFSRFLYTYHFVGEAAREATRYAMVRGSTFSTACSSSVTFACYATAANIQSYVQSITPPGINSASLTFNANFWPGAFTGGAATPNCGVNGTTGLADNPGCLIQVQVSYPFTFIFPFMPKSALTWTVSSKSEMVISQ